MRELSDCSGLANVWTGAPWGRWRHHPGSTGAIPPVGVALAVLPTVRQTWRQRRVSHITEPSQP